MTADLLFLSPSQGSPNLVFGGGDTPAPPATAAQYDDSQPRGELLFQRPAAEVTTTLVFGDVGGTQTPVVVDPVTLTAQGALTGLRGAATLRIVNTVVSSGTLTGLRGAATLRIVVQLSANKKVTGIQGHVGQTYDNNLTRYLQGAVTAQHNPAIPAEIDLSAGHGISQYQRGGVITQWQQSVAHRDTLDASHSTAVKKRHLADALWQLATLHRTNAQAQHQVADKRVMTARTGYALAQPWQYLTTSGMQTGIPLRKQLHSHWQPADHRQHIHGGRSGASLRRWGRQFEVARWQQGMHPLTGRSQLPLPPAAAEPCYLPDPQLVFDAPWSADANLVFVCERHATPTLPDAAVTVPILRIYVTINSITLRRVDGNVPIPAHAFSMSLDADSWTWSWSASVPLSALELVQPGSNGDPVEVEAMVNGIPYRLCAEGIGRQREFAKGRVTVQGRGTAAILDAPYAPVLNHGNTGPRTAQQLMADVLTVNGVGIGWAVDWGLTDWLVPGNVWTHQGAYISAILAIASAAGGYVQPHDTAQTLRILPRYPVAPWDWGSITPDFELPSSVVSVEGTDWQRKADYNRVFVGGTRNGVLGQVTRAGTAGDSVAPMITDALITHAVAARQRGLAILSDTGAQARISLKLPVLGETGLITPGKFVRYTQAGQAQLGLVRSTSLEWISPRLRQTISLETHPA